MCECGDVCCNLFPNCVPLLLPLLQVPTSIICSVPTLVLLSPGSLANQENTKIYGEDISLIPSVSLVFYFFGSTGPRLWEVLPLLIRLNNRELL